MKGVSIIIRGFENIAAKELESIGAKDIQAKNGYVLFNIKDYKGLAKIAYLTQTSSRVFLLLKRFKLNNTLNEDYMIKSLEKIDFPAYLNKDSTFKVKCERIGEQNFSCIDFEPVMGSAIISVIQKNSGRKQKVTMNNPDVIVYCYIIDDECLVGIDFCGFNIAKRDYHIFTNRRSIKGDLAALLLYSSGIKKGDFILDPIIGSGTCVIEGALLSQGKSINHYRKDDFIFKKLRQFDNINFEDFFNNSKKKPMELEVIGFDSLLANMKSAQKNAKIAGVNKNIRISKADIEWLDTKLDKNSVDKIVTRLKSVSKLSAKKDIEKIYKEFFYQSDYILKKNGIITVLIQKDELLAEIGKKYKFEVYMKTNIMIGKQSGKVISFKKY